MATVAEMNTSLEDTRWFHQTIDEIVRGPQHGHDLAVIRRYFRGYLHCWKTVLHLIRDAKGLGGARRKDDWVRWCERWQAGHLESPSRETMDQLRETRDYDTHSGTIEVSGEVAAGLFPLAFVGPVKASHVRRELVTCTSQGLDIIERLIATHATT